MRRTVLVLSTVILTASLASAAIPIGRADYARRRAALYEKLPPGSALLVLTGDPIKDEEFHYFTGVALKGAAFLALKDGPAEFLFVPPRQPSYGVSEDEKIGPGEAAQAETGIARVLPNTDVVKAMAGLLEGVSRLYADKLMDRPDPLGVAITPQAALLEKLQAARPGLAVEDVFFLAADVRGIKAPAEIERIREAVSLCGRGVMEAMRLARPGLYEYHLEAAAGYIYRSAGARTSFVIVGSGPNSVILHHRTNDRRLEAGDLVVLDIGAEVERYGSDITRTFPVSGKFNEEQRKVYEIVLDANRQVIAAAKPGLPVEELDKIARGVIEKAGYGKYFNHGVSHPIAMGGMGPLAPGMVITVEPGIYLPEKGFGIRIEDDVLITPEGNEVLSSFVPKEIADIERLMAERSVLEPSE